jgi:hypothetical protein
MDYQRNLAHEISKSVAELELQRDKLLLALEGMVNITSGNFRERVVAVNIIFEIKNATLKHIN